ncbi:hypothetical protein [Photorhabdus asymbiotica]|uniref:hypothetical protein n=1 Tax=Photorhabdus asymbiotica TaxID=291112 RepID=UPI003DA72047
MPWLSGAAVTTGMIGAGANTGIQYLANGNVDPNDAIFAYWTGVFTANTGLWGTIAWNAGMGAASSYVKGDDPIKGGMISGAGSAIGYGAGKYITSWTNAAGKWLTHGWDPKFNPNLLKYSEVKGQFGISKEMSPSKIPGIVGNMGASITTEGTNSLIQEQINKAQEKGNGSPK